MLSAGHAPGISIEVFLLGRAGSGGLTAAGYCRPAMARDGGLRSDFPHLPPGRVPGPQSRRRRTGTGVFVGVLGCLGTGFLLLGVPFLALVVFRGEFGLVGASFVLVGVALLAGARALRL